MVDTLDDGTIVADELAEIFQEMDFAVIRDIVENTNGDIKQCVRFCCDMNPEMNEFDVCAAIVAKRREDDEKKKEEEKRRKKEVEKQRQSPDAERLQDRQERERRMKEAAERAAAEEERERRMKLAMKVCTASAAAQQHPSHHCFAADSGGNHRCGRVGNAKLAAFPPCRIFMVE
eukprot:TRINITY_DN48816_c0_g1_i2.p3 TRINITY_DN48816_c0_g1~~TRINITY_DN48816_c0_g1_i2.p3  ORF type:complete len:175 (-),score=28.62 TRINITY_DN48816_c0_g1_i2:1145-1669(-)